MAEYLTASRVSSCFSDSEPFAYSRVDIVRRLPVAEGFWCFQCAECGFGNEELGRLADDQEFCCEVCLDEGRGEVRLQRWLGEEAAPVYARLRGVLAA